jgi:SAM-dependent methyltransferase
LIWTLDDKKLENTLLRSTGFEKSDFDGKLVIDVGCGNGSITSKFAEFGAETIGFDLSSSVFMAQKHFLNVDRLHFVQGSLFYPPFREHTFSLVYSTGTLHHTFDTKKAFEAIAPLCKESGRLYVWLYGEYLGRDKVFNFATNAVRRVISRARPAFQDAFIETAAYPYSLIRKLGDSGVVYNKNQLIHTMRDRFTPKYAHLHNRKEVVEWFKKNNFENVIVVDSKGVAVRGTKKLI